jgi:hypothetical protein
MASPRDIKEYGDAVRGYMNPESLYFTRGSSPNKAIYRVTNELDHVSDMYTCTDITGHTKSFEVTKNYFKNAMVAFHKDKVVEHGIEDIFRPGVLGTNKSNVKVETYTKEAAKEERNKQTTAKKETKKMSKTSQVINSVKDANVEAAKVTAKIAAGKALNTAVQSKIVPKMPIMIRGYAQTDLGKIAIANVVATALTYYAPNDARAKMVSEAMIQSAMCDLMAAIDVEGMVKEFLSSDAADRIVNVSV